MSGDAIQLLWLIYITGTAITVISLWFLMARLPRWLKLNGCAAVAALLATPFVADSNTGSLAPAWTVSLVEGFQKGEAAGTFLRAGLPLLGMMAFAMMLATVYLLLSRKN